MEKTTGTANYIYINPVDSKVAGFIQRQKKINCYAYCLAMFGIAYAAAMTRVTVSQQAELRRIKKSLKNCEKK